MPVFSRRSSFTWPSVVDVDGRSESSIFCLPYLATIVVVAVAEAAVIVSMIRVKDKFGCQSIVAATFIKIGGAR